VYRQRPDYRSLPLHYVITKHKRPSNSVFETEVDSGLALLDANSNTYFLLNKTGAVIWAQLEQSSTLEEICNELANRFDVAAEDCRDDVVSLLESLESKGFLISSDESAS